MRRLLALLAVSGAIALLIWFCVWSERRWQRYAHEHHCTAVAHGGYWTFMPISCGKDCTTVTPIYVPTTTYRCDDGFVTR